MNTTTLEIPTVNTEQPSLLADIHDRVMEAYYGKLGDQFMRETQARIHWICAQVKGRRVLDVGCSQGIVPLLLAREGCQVTGVDTSPQAIDEAKGYMAAEPAHVQQNVTYVNADFLSLDIVDVEPDSIVISEVLEHLVRPELFVEKASDLLKVGGRLVITVPFGVNDFIDHKHTFYLMEPFRLLSEHLQIVEIKVLGKWLGIVAQKADAYVAGSPDALPITRVRELEKAFEAIERSLRENISAISKRLDEANKKYRSATEQISQLKPEAQMAQALSKELQAGKADLAEQHQAHREVVEANARIAQELSEIKQRLDEANRKYRAATEQIAVLKPEAAKVEPLSSQVQDQQAKIATLEQASQASLETSARNIQALNAELDALRQQLGEANEKYSTITDQFGQLKAQFHALELAHQQSEQETGQKIATLQDELCGAQARELALQEQLADTRAQLHQAQAKAADQTAQIEDLHLSSNERLLTIDALRNEQASLNQQIEHLQNEHSALMNTISTLTQQRSTLETQAQALTEAMANSEAQRGYQADSITMLMHQREQLQNQLEGMTEAMACAEQARINQSETITLLMEQRGALENNLQTLTSANVQIEEQSANQALTIATLEQTRAALEEQLRLESTSREAAEATLAATQEEWQSLRHQLEQELNTSRTGLGVANMKYRAVTGEQIPHLKASLSQLLERSATQQRKIDELNENLQRANSQRHLAEQRLVKTRASLTYQLGYQIKSSANSLGGLVKLPVRLLRLYRKANKQRQQSQQKLLAAEAPPLNLPPAPPLQDATYLQLPPALASSEHSRTQLLRSAEHPASKLKVACIMDEFTYGSYRHECDLQPLTPGNWKAELDNFGPQLLFIESAWRGKDDLWGSKVGHNSQELQDIIAWCRQHKVPTVFWNKEDPVHFETFLTTAKQFDHVFTTDIDCIHRYKGALGHERVYLLPFACQPALHNPIELYERKDAFCFAGAYYARYPERTRDLGNFVSELAKFRPLEIFDRNYGKNDVNYQFPAEYQPYIIGTLPFEKIDTAYKGYRYAINLNSIKQSQSMFARRVFELLGCNTLTVSNFSRGVRLLFGDLVVTTDNGEEMLRRLKLLAEDPLNSDKLRLAALRKVMQEHTYTQRLDYVLSKVTGSSETRRLPQIAVIAEANDAAQLAAIRGHLDRQTHDNVRLLLLSDALDTRAIQDDPRIQLVKRAGLKKTTIGQLVGDTPWVTGLCAEDYYGPNYLLDLALATRYSRASMVGKVAHFAWDGKEAQLLASAQAYRPTEGLSARRTLISTELVASQTLRNWLKNLPTLHYTLGQGLAIDPFNYCENGNAQQSLVTALVDDLEIDCGLTIDQLQKRAQSIAPLQVSHDSPEITGRELSELFGVARNKFLDLEVDADNWRIHSKLADGKHEYLYALQEMSVEQLNVVDGKLKLFLDCTPGLNLQWVVLFLDADKQRISHVMQHANRNQTSDVPPEAKFVRFGLRAYAAGNAEIKALVLGHRDLQPSEMLGRSEHLLITNHYPAYADLYRNGFVHSRVMAYQQQRLSVDIFRLRKNEAVSYHEFQNVDVVTGCQATLGKMLESGQYRSVLVHFLDPEMWSVLKHYTNRVKIVVWVHGAEIQPWWRREYNYSDESQLAAAKLESDKRMAFWRETLGTMPTNLKLVFVSRYFAEEVMEDMGFRLPEDRYEIIHNPIDTEIFSYQEKPAEQRMKLLSIRPYASAKYANDLSVKAIELLAEKPYFQDLEIRMIGDGVLFEETLAPLRKFSNVKIERGFLKHQEIAALHKQYGLFLCPTRMDAQGVSRDEAMASGLVAVTNSVTAIPEFVDEHCGLLAPGDDAHAMADGIARVIESPELFKSLSAAARARVEKQTSKHSIICREIELIR
ncbi:glycosyltransferase [Pseudomonas faucium]|uniref:glycosyltransferase family protein n=1 Tax=Pseudomonas faucium TaxID=2740518 RepID=UPI0039C26DBD